MTFQRFTFLCVSLLATVFLQAQIESREGFSIICEHRDTFVSYVPPHDGFMANSQVSTPFILTFTDSVPAEAEASMQFAADIWGSYLQSDVPVNVLVDWRDQGDERQLASAGPSEIWAGFAGAVARNVWYPVALAEAILGDTLNGLTDPDINIVVNSTANWHFETDGVVPRRQSDLATVFLHELGHGLGFLSSIDSTSDTTLAIGFGVDELPIIYDLFLETPDGLQLSDPDLFPSPGTELLDAVVDVLEFGGDTAVNRNGGEQVPLFAPVTFDVGSSVSHLEENAFRRGTPDALMTPFLAGGEAIYDPGAVTLGILVDLGWPVIFDPVSTRPPVVAGRLGIFPNPATNYATIALEELERPGMATLYDAGGRRVRELVVDAQARRVSIDVHDLPPGLYTLTVPDLSDGRVYSGRLLISR